MPTAGFPTAAAGAPVTTVVLPITPAGPVAPASPLSLNALMP